MNKLLSDWIAFWQINKKKQNGSRRRLAKLPKNNWMDE